MMIIFACQRLKKMVYFRQFRINIHAMKKYAIALAAAGIMLAGAGCTGSTSTTVALPPATPPAQAPAPAAQGRTVFTVTDAATALTGVTAVNVTVDKLEAHDAANGWVTVSTTAKTYDLLQLKQTASAALLADANLAAGTYDQIRLHISKVEVTANGKTQTVVLPSNSLKIVGNLTVKAGQTSTASLDFMVDKSLHMTGDGKFILAPVVRLLVKNAVGIKIGSDDKVEVSGGSTESDQTEGMDENGDMKANFELDKNLELDAQGAVKVRL